MPTTKIAAVSAPRSRSPRGQVQALQDDAEAHVQEEGELLGEGRALVLSQRPGPRILFFFRVPACLPYWLPIPESDRSSHGIPNLESIPIEGQRKSVLYSGFRQF